MKRLTTYLKDNKSSLISLNEKLIINKNYKNAYNYSPKTFDELRQIIEDRYDKLGPGTEQKPINLNDIDISNIDSFYDENMGIFEGTEFEYIDISEWDVSNVKDMHYMFSNCDKLESVGDLSYWDDLWPWIYAKFHNKKWRKKYADYNGYLMQDFVGTIYIYGNIKTIFRRKRTNAGIRTRYRRY